MYKVDICGGGQEADFIARSKSGSFAIDLKNRGVNPPEALLAALGSCIGVYLRKYAEGSGLELGEFTISVESEFSHEPPLRFEVIKTTIDLKGLQLDERRKKAMLEFIKNCPVGNTLKSAPQVDTVLL